MRYVLIVFFVVRVLSVDIQAQVGIQLETIDNFQSGFVNLVVSSDDAYYLLFNLVYPNSGRRALGIRKYDFCHQLIWSKRYTTSSSIDLHDAVWDEDRLVILSFSNQKYPFLTTLTEAGEIIFHHSYHHSTFDNLYNLSITHEGYNFFGSSDGRPSRYSVDKDGNLISADVLVTRLSSQELGARIPFGSATFSNGFTLRRYGNVLLGINADHQIVWAQQMEGRPGSIFNERQAVEVPGGFVVLADLDHLFILKMNYEGELEWVSPELNLDYYATDIEYYKGKIYFATISRADPISQINLVSVQASNGQINTATSFAIEDQYGLSFPGLSINPKGDKIISTSSLIDFSNDQWKDLIFINPSLLDCVQDYDMTTGAAPIVPFRDVTEFFSTQPIMVDKEEPILRVQNNESNFNTSCLSAKRDTLTVTMDCHQQYVFDNPYPGHQYLWSDGSSDSVRLIEEAGSYQIEVRSCGTWIQLYLDVAPPDCNCSYYIPNILKINSSIPENSSLSFQYNCSIENFNIQLYDRWGKLVYESSDPNFRWNTHSQKTPIGVYVYRAHFKWSAQTTPIQTHGTLTVMY